MKFFIISILSFLFVIQLEGQTPGQLTVTATTVTYGGTFAPNHVVAVWVQSKTGTFVKTLLAYATTRKSYLSSWSAVTSATYNAVDAVTGATKGTHGLISCKWNGENLTGTVLGDDTYTVALEMTEGGNERYYTFQFKKSGTEQILTPTNVSGFSNITIKWTPSLTALENVNLRESYSVYPVPVKSLLFVNGSDVVEIQVYTLSGKYLFSTNENPVNMVSLKKGVYVILIKSPKVSFLKKIIKD